MYSCMTHPAGQLKGSKCDQMSCNRMQCAGILFDEAEHMAGPRLLVIERTKTKQALHEINSVRDGFSVS